MKHPLTPVATKVNKRTVRLIRRKAKDSGLRPSAYLRRLLETDLGLKEGEAA